jgi:hypothetical protein
VPIILIVLVFSFRNSLNQQKQSWASYRLSIEPDFICRTQDNFATVQIFKDEISSIKDYSGSIVVQARKSSDRIIIPATLENFSEVRSLLSQWHEIEVYKSKIHQNNLSTFAVTR